MYVCYVLLKIHTYIHTFYFAIFQRGGNDIFSHIAAIFENMPFNKEYRILVKKSIPAKGIHYTGVTERISN